MERIPTSQKAHSPRPLERMVQAHMEQVCHKNMSMELGRMDMAPEA
jgi:hypothetical protein